jgi:hypothetical protein
MRQSAAAVPHDPPAGPVLQALVDRIAADGRVSADEALDVYIVVPITQQWLVYHLAN